MPDIDLADELEPQDRAETFDETHLTEDGEDIANFDEIEDVYDVTSEPGDEDDEEGLDHEVIADEPASSDELDPDDETSDEALSPADMESDTVSDKELAKLGYHDDRRPADHDPHTERQLDKGLEETFPASDPVSINPGAD